ncbi:MAG: YggS family pyridoxal phosphate-dependent enzyme [Clostridium sp.]|uniref:YggS family pyridoxal phosphate-dependent enzyme n=1 Tax=Clostridium TaxID=1485 RepID=UPI001883FA2A|nr:MULTISPECIES: YggS family pyridoxal phosphate-dependent enzyme [Clostridium]MCR6515402.1 YggS family pyridoxal phosphate-dependent enzyme [Clostridium sp. LY3-2]
MSIKENIDEILNEIPKDVKLLAVSKTRTLDEMKEAYDAGMREFAENKVQELLWKEEEFQKDVKWHLIGKLQRNKVKYIVGKVDLIHSLSSEKLLDTIETKFGEANETIDCLIQINIGREDSKSGVLVEELDSLIEAVEKCNFVKVKGIMVIIPKGSEKENREYFKETKKIFDSLKEKEFKNITMEILSMGMTNDYKIAIEEGSNTIRVGTGIFGERDYSV